MKSGDLRHRIVLEQPVRSKNTMGEQIDTFTAVTTVWAAVEPLTGSWLFQAQQADSKVSGRVRIRYREDIKPFWRILFDGRYLSIISILNPDERKKELIIMYSEELD
jgi:SPP1 family predicted phage head-tail adaptor